MTVAEWEEDLALKIKKSEQITLMSDKVVNVEMQESTQFTNES